MVRKILLQALGRSGDKCPCLLLCKRMCIIRGAFLVAQWLRLCLPRQGMQLQSLVGELRAHMPHGQKTKV